MSNVCDWLGYQRYPHPKSNDVPFASSVLIITIIRSSVNLHKQTSYPIQFLYSWQRISGKKIIIRCILIHSAGSSGKWGHWVCCCRLYICSSSIGRAQRTCLRAVLTSYSCKSSWWAAAMLYNCCYCSCGCLFRRRCCWRWIDAVYGLTTDSFKCLQLVWLLLNQILWRKHKQNVVKVSNA